MYGRKENTARGLWGVEATKREGFRKGDGGKRIETWGLVDGEGGGGGRNDSSTHKEGGGGGGHKNEGSPMLKDWNCPRKVPRPSSSALWFLRILSAMITYLRVPLSSLE